MLSQYKVMHVNTVLVETPGISVELASSNHIGGEFTCYQTVGIEEKANTTTGTNAPIGPVVSGPASNSQF